MKRLNWRYIAFFLSLILIVAPGCSPTKHYKTLSFFFDGVPNPNAGEIPMNDSLTGVDSIFTKGNSARPPKPTFVFHPPYQDKECENCHDKGVMGTLNEPLPGLCYNCHEDFADQYSFVHGPVSSGFCTKCHNPHMAKLEKLIIRSGQQLCLFCHQLSDVMANDVHEDLGETDCTECHNPHGGDDKYILN